jgi:hypothetical protein
MKINDDFETDSRATEFNLLITSETDFSQDGGYTFEMQTNSVNLNKDQAKELIKELALFVAQV